MAKSILITGCSSGIGACAAKLLHARGYRVFATARNIDDLLELKQLGCEVITLDINNSTSIQAAVATVKELTGNQLDALINNAGFGQPGAVEDLTRAALRQQFETNVFGLIELTNLIIPIMRWQGYGRIINLSSVLGLISLPYRGAYNATKFSVEALSDALRLELHGTGIYVSLIEPGPITSKFRNTAVKMADNVDINNSVHAKTYAQMRAEQLNTKEMPFTLPPEAVVNKLIHALENNKPRIRYYVTIYTYVVAYARRVFSTRILDLLTILLYRS